MYPSTGRGPGERKGRGSTEGFFSRFKSHLPRLCPGPPDSRLHDIGPRLSDVRQRGEVTDQGCLWDGQEQGTTDDSLSETDRTETGYGGSWTPVAEGRTTGVVGGHGGGWVGTRGVLVGRVPVERRGDVQTPIPSLVSPDLPPTFRTT